MSSVRLDIEELRAIEHNELQFLARHRSATWPMGFGELFVSSDRSVKTWNFIGALDIAGELERSIGICRQVFTDWNMTPCLKVTPFSSPPELPAYLRDHGWSPAVTLTHMVANGDGALDAGPSAVRVRACTTSADIRLFSEVQSAGFGVPQWVAWVEKTNAINLHHPGQAFYIAEIDGAAVAVALLLISDTVAGLYAVATLPEARRRGASRALAARAYRDAIDRGAEVVCLNTLKGGPAEQVFARLGFRSVFDSQFFVS